jgi:hypothetical protein
MTDLFSLNENQTSKEIAELLPKEVVVQEYKSHNLRTGKLEDGTEVWVITDVIAAITQSKDPQHYWYVLKKRMQNEGNEDVTNCYTLKIETEDGKMRDVEVMTREQILRMLQSIPSKKAEPFKLWLAKLGNERLEEIENPSKGIDNAIKRWKQMGKSDGWIYCRLKGIEVRHAETEVLSSHGINSPKDFAHFTDRTNVAVYGHTAKEEKINRGIAKTSNLRDNSTKTELILLSLHEATCKEGIEKRNAYGKKQIDGVYDVVGSIISNTARQLSEAFA